MKGEAKFPYAALAAKGGAASGATSCLILERDTGVGPVLSDWKSDVLPMN